MELDNDTTTAAPEIDSRRDDIERAFEQAETPDPSPAAPPAPAPAPAAAPPLDAPAAPAPGERARGPDGKFVAAPDAPAKPAAKPVAAPAAAPPPVGAKPPAAPLKAPLDAPAAQPAAAAPTRAPVSWKPDAREHWAKLPPEVQREVVRRETEVARTLQESSRAREALQHVQQVMSPFAANIAASGTDALTVMGELLKADNTLRHGSIGDKATLIGNIIKTYGVNIEALDAVLAGQPAKADPNAMLADQLRREMREQLQPIMQHFGQLRGQRENAMAQISQKAATDVQSFSEANEFFEDVRVDMADIIDLYTARGQSISLQDAYDRAIKLNPQVSEIVAKRAEAERASAAQRAAQQARRTAVGLSSAPAPAGAVPGASPDDRRAVIAAAFDQAQG